ncbi:MAG: glycosyltransferase [Lachnospiraceae bacterium]|nr:glycosyltransferase [Lachnospiraceae bacterium]
MLKILNIGANCFRTYSNNKRVFIFGAGRTLDSCLDIYFENTPIEAIIDNNPEKWGSKIVYNGRSIDIISVDDFIKRVKKDGVSEYILFISVINYAVEIVEQLDKYYELDGLECALMILVRNTIEFMPSFEFTNGEQKIPKIIHYIWVGGKSLPYEYQKNIDTWKKYNPEYEIKCWNEDNYDINKCNYVREAYESGNWGFVPNYMRLDIIYEEGGIYLDTDVEAVANFDKLLKDEAFFNMGCTDRVNQGCGFGAVKHSQIINDMRREFERVHFIEEKTGIQKIPCHKIIHPVIKKYGFTLENTYQNIDGIVLYPKEVMSPKTIKGFPDMISNKTVSIHKEESSWKDDKEKEQFNRIESFIRERVKP